MQRSESGAGHDTRPRAILLFVEGTLDAVLYRYLVAGIAKQLGLNCRFCSLPKAKQRKGLCNTLEVVRPAISFIERYLGRNVECIDVSKWLECDGGEGTTFTVSTVPLGGKDMVEKALFSYVCLGTGKASVSYAGIVDADEKPIEEKIVKALRRAERSCHRYLWAQPELLCPGALRVRHRGGRAWVYYLVQGIDTDSPLKMFPDKSAIEDYMPLIIEQLGFEPRYVVDCTRTCSTSCGVNNRAASCWPGKQFMRMLQLLYCAPTEAAAVRTLAEKAAERLPGKSRDVLPAKAVYTAFERASPCIVAALEEMLKWARGGVGAAAQGSLA